MTENCYNCAHVDVDMNDKEDKCFWCMRMWDRVRPNSNPPEALFVYFRPAKEPLLYSSSGKELFVYPSPGKGE